MVSAYHLYLKKKITLFYTVKVKVGYNNKSWPQPIWCNEQLYPLDGDNIQVLLCAMNIYVNIKLFKADVCNFLQCTLMGI